MRTLVLMAALWLAGCNRDQSITRGADGNAEWNRRVRAAVPVGSSVADAQSTLEHNGFRCARQTLGEAQLRCE